MAQEYALQLEAALPMEGQLGAVDFEDGWREISTAIGITAQAALGTAVQNRRNDWFDGECEQLKEEKNAAWARLLPKKEASTGKTIPRMFYEKLNRSRKGYMPQADMCRDSNGDFLTNECEVVERWRQYYDEHLNGDVTSNDGGTVTNLGARAIDEIF